MRYAAHRNGAMGIVVFASGQLNAVLNVSITFLVELSVETLYRSISTFDIESRLGENAWSIKFACQGQR